MLIQWYFSIPAVTRWLGSLMCLIFILSWFASSQLSLLLCLSPLSFLPSPQFNFFSSLFTLFISTYTHIAFFHIFWNLSVLVYYGGILERKWGSLKFALNTLLFGILSNLLHVFMALILNWIPMLPEFLKSSLVNTCSLGFSGVLFFYIAIDCFEPSSAQSSSSSSSSTSSESIQVFGLMPVPKRYYPWIMLILMQVMILHVSFLGHLSGLLWGLLYARDAQHIMHIKSNWIEYMENTSLIQTWLAPRTLWIPKTQLQLGMDSSSNIPPSISFTHALQQQLHTLYPLRPQQQPENQISSGERAMPASMASSANPPSTQSYSNIKSMTDLAKSSTSNYGMNPGQGSSSSSSSSSTSASSSTTSSSQYQAFQGEGKKLGGR